MLRYGIIILSLLLLAAFLLLLGKRAVGNKSVQREIKPEASMNGQDGQDKEKVWDYIRPPWISYGGDTRLEESAIKLVDKALKEHGNFGAYGDLSCGLERLKEKELAVSITAKPDYYEVSVYPASGNGGHDFGFRVDMKTGNISNLAVGTPVPNPESKEGITQVVDYGQEFTVLKGGEGVEFPDGFKFAFIGHSHKRTAGEPSPLVIYASYVLKGKEAKKYVNIYYPKEREWEWENYRFVLLGYGYDAYMQMKVLKD